MKACIQLTMMAWFAVTLGSCSKSVLSGAETVDDTETSTNDGSDGTTGSSVGNEDSAAITGVSSNELINDTSLTLNITSDGATGYKYKVGLASSTDCSDESGYGDETDIDTPLQADLSGIADGEIVVCVITINESGVWQDTSNAAELSFSKDTADPTITATTTVSTASSFAPTVSVSETATYAWSKVSGPGTVSFSDDTALQPTVGFSSDGSYVIKIVATDEAGNTSEETISVTYDSTAPDPLSSTGDAQGNSYGLIDLTLNLPGDVSDYDQIRVYRSTGSASTGVAAPADCSSGTLVGIANDFSSTPITISDHADTAAYYYSYRVCILDAVGNETSSDTIIDAQAGADLAYSRIFSAENYEDNGGASGDISTDTTTSVWDDLDDSANANLTNMTLTDADTGWYGTGTSADPYRLSFDGTDDYVDVPGSHSAYGWSIWYKTDDATAASAARGLATADSNFYASSIYKSSVYSRWNSGSVAHYMPIQDSANWHHFAIMRDADGGRSYFLDGMLFENSEAATANFIETWNLGADNAGANTFDGVMGDYRIINGVERKGDAFQLYADTRALFIQDPGGLSVERVDGGYFDAAAGGEFKVKGWGMDGVTSVTIGGQAATKIAKVRDVYLNVTAPAMSAGSYDVVITDGSTTETIANAVTYTDVVLTKPVTLFDAQNTDALGTNAANASDATHWKDVINGGRNGVMFNFSYPDTTDSGWKGSGSTSDPYRLVFDGTDDYVFTGDHYATGAYSVWFKIHSMASDGYIFYDYSSPVSSFCYVNSGTLYCRYNDNVGTISTAVTTDTWYHVVVTYDSANTDAIFYLDNSAFGTDSTVASRMLQSRNTLGSSSIDGADYFDGEIIQFQRFYQELSVGEVDDLYNEGLSRIQ